MNWLEFAGPDVRVNDGPYEGPTFNVWGVGCGGCGGCGGDITCNNAYN